MSQVETSNLTNAFYIACGKRVFDLVLAVSAIIVLSPLLAFTAFLVRLLLASPVIYKQIRPGLNEKPFVLLKFRTMTDNRNKKGGLLPDAERLTPLGTILRKTSIDELPELINVIKGDMGIVGPRPLFVHYLPYYTERERLRHTVRPGITGLSQVSGRNYLPWDQRLETDVQYIEKLSFSLDIKIMLKTFLQVLKTKNVAVPGTVSIPLSEYREQMKNNKSHMDKLI